MKRINFFFLIISFCFLCNQNFAINNFIVSKQDDLLKKLSKNQLKENIGDQIKEVLHDCAELNKQLGLIQVQLSNIEKQLFDKISELIDNKNPFKKAGRVDLSSSFKILNNVRKELINQVDVVKNLHLQINKDKCLKKS
ncbi:hypothetical protein GF322_02395 [Candidatus Dependentiae bacterium]|nr:hypothetical protein [Candidatus Dependentiae bacterium]